MARENGPPQQAKKTLELKLLAGFIYNYAIARIHSVQYMNSSVSQTGFLQLHIGTLGYLVSTVWISFATISNGAGI